MKRNVCQMLKMKSYVYDLRWQQSLLNKRNVFFFYYFVTLQRVLVKLFVNTLNMTHGGLVKYDL